MKHFKYLLIFSFIFSTTSIIAQRFNRFNLGTEEDLKTLYKSINELEDITLKNVNTKRILAEFYYNVRNYLNAEIYYYDVVSSPENTNEDIYNYASILSINEKYYESNYWMKEFAKLEPNDSRTKRFLKDQDYFDVLLIDQNQFRIKNSDINTKYKESGTSYYNDNVVFSSTRSRIGFKKRIWNKLPETKLFKAKLLRGKLSDVKIFKGIFNKKYRNIHVAFSSDASYMAYTAYNIKSKTKSGIKKLHIFFSEVTDNKISEPVPCPFNSNEFSVGYVAVNETGNIMIFTSDMTGGYGGSDLYKSFKNDEGVWTEPINLGSAINTEGNEMFPFIHNDGLLFFASDGFSGLGGLDIYYTKLTGEEYTSPKNLGVPVNSSKDDFAFMIDRRMRRGFFSSNRDFGKGDDDIYSFRLLKPFTFDLILIGKTKDVKGNIIANANVGLFDNNGEIIRMKNSDSEGNFEFKVTQNKSYDLEGTKPKYKKDIETVNTELKEGTIYQDLILEKLPDFVLLCTVQDKANHVKLSGVKVKYKEIKNEFADNDTTNNDGKLFIGLEKNRLKDTINYTLKFEKAGYASKTLTYNDVLDIPGEYKINVKLKKIQIGEDLSKILEMNPIYFDYDKSSIRKDAAEELDKVVEIMNEYPNMVIELSSHTDCRGSSIYNLKLSDRRAKASAHYIKIRISNPTRIYGEGYGESKLINDCGCEGSKKSDCTDEEHQQNRRTEIRILRM